MAVSKNLFDEMEFIVYKNHIYCYIWSKINSQLTKIKLQVSVNVILFG